MDGPHFVSFQNGDMEPQYHRVANCGWCLDGWPLSALMEYVLRS